jgi:hypothetical protein
VQHRPRIPSLVSQSHPLATAFAALILVLVCGLFIVNNLAGFFGYQSFGPMSMFSGLRTTSDNHFLMPRVPLGDADAYVTVQRLDARAVASPESKQFRDLVAYVNEERRMLHLNVVRWQVSRTCRSADDAVVRLTLRSAEGEQREYANACQEPELARYELLTSYPPCGPSGCIHLRRYLRAADAAPDR